MIVRGDGRPPFGDSAGPDSAHDRFAEHVAAYADGELEAGLERELERHLADCESCRREMEVQCAVRDRLGREPTPAVSARLLEGIRDSIREPANGAQGRARTSTWLRSGLAAAAVLALVLFGSWERARRASTTVGSPADIDAIQQLIAAHADAWNRGDAPAAVEILADDAVWTTAEGEVLRGRAEIERAHVRWMAEDGARGRAVHVHPLESVHIRFPNSEVALVDLESRFVASGPDGSPLLRERTATFMVATKGADGWRVTEVRNAARPLS
jgi:uncharacterized protein (TIGR02246 family)